MNRLRTFLAQYQVVWWWPRIKITMESEWGFGFRRTKPIESMSLIYEWFWQVGPLDVRKWVTKADMPTVLRKHREAWDTWNNQLSKGSDDA